RPDRRSQTPLSNCPPGPSRRFHLRGSGHPSAIQPCRFHLGLGLGRTFVDKVGAFFYGLTDRTDEVKRRCRTVLQTQADAFTSAVQAILQPSHPVDPTLALV